MTENGEKSVEQVLKESKELAKVTLSLDVAESGPWRSPEEVELWVKDHYEMTDQGIGEPAASDCANIRESIRIAAKVDQALSEEAMNRCLKLQTGIFGLSKEKAKQKCEYDFTKDHDQRGEKAYESRSLAGLVELMCKLNSEILGFRYNFKELKFQTPNEAEISARRKLGLPKIITITKDETPKEDKRVLLDHMPSTYQKTSEEILKERREYDRTN
jgi:hypothetical protein